MQATEELLQGAPVRSWVAAKIHGVYVTDTRLDYHGSVSIGRELLKASGIQPYEQVHVVNLNNGQRWITYALEVVGADDTAFECNGGGARLANIGDRCVVMTFVQSERFTGAPVLQIAERAARTSWNHHWELLRYGD